MLSFFEYNTLSEAAIRVSGKMYPKFGQIVILAGGAGSGKGFVKEMLLAVEGKTFDVDEIKKAAIASDKLAARIKKETGEDLKKFNLKDPENVKKVHELLGIQYGVDKKVKSSAYSSILTAAPDRKPNLIFDVTLKDTKKLRTIAADAEKLGYDKKNIHIVWVLNKFEVAVKQNQERSRVVPSGILLHTHEGAAMTMNEIMSMGDSLKSLMDGDIFIAFNQAKVDTDLRKSGKGGSYLKKANYIQVKRNGKPPLSQDKLSKSIQAKIKDYAPDMQ